MRCELENVLVDCLRETLHIMLCSGSSETVRAAERSLKQCPVYSLFKAKSPETMEELLHEVPSWHVAVIDQQCQFSSDFTGVVARYATWLPVITLTNSWSIRSLSSSMMMGNGGARPAGTGPAQGNAGSVENRRVETCLASSLGNLMHHVQEWAIKRKLLSKPLSGLAAEAMDALFRENPLSVDDWSSIMGVKPRRFQREFKLFTDLSPKKILALYHAYRIAFTVIDEQNSREKGIIPAYIVDDRSRERVMEYVLTHRSALLTGAN
jgi:AraC-like DNA-binding protein